MIAALGLGAAIGVLLGLLGGGGGILAVPALVLFLGLPMPLAVGTSLAVLVINSAAGFAAHAGDATLDHGITAVFTATAIIGSLLAGRFGVNLPADRLRGSFAYLVLAVAAFVAVQATVNPPSS
ncbi:TSUP family transporter [Parafrankia sp. EUN1f]|uniref:TSUP family transporter n=1 Tax=Parafrankia sp. EUN1f TaxID=102897 RepID=UPI0001C43A22|nr:TSUP family transporter [Parafrankia sp. EUN1f]EFC84927.1 conserved hypothetical protein [Parafrankia sp. EUN1f]